MVERVFLKIRLFLWTQNSFRLTYYS